MSESKSASGAAEPAVYRTLFRLYLAGLAGCGVAFGTCLDHGDAAWAVIFGLLLASGLAIGWWQTRDLT